MSEAREIAESQLETALKDVLTDEFEDCWSRIKDDPAITDAEEEMSDLMEWFGEQVQAIVEDVVEQDPADDDDDIVEDDDDEDEDEDTKEGFEEE